MVGEGDKENLASPLSLRQLSPLPLVVGVGVAHLLKVSLGERTDFDSFEQVLFADELFVKSSAINPIHQLWRLVKPLSNNKNWIFNRFNLHLGAKISQNYQLI
jgi:hypothetical protein